MSAPGRELDARWARWAVSFMALLVPAAILLITANDWAVLGVCVAFLAALIAYCSHLLFRRMQCSLLEWCAIILALGNLEGLLLTTPGMFASTFLCGLLAPLTAAWIFYGTLRGLAQAQLLGLAHPAARVALLCANWFTLAAPAMIVLAVGLHFGKSEVIGRSLAAWATPLIVVGSAGLALRIWLAAKTVQAARKILGKA